MLSRLPRVVLLAMAIAVIAVMFGGPGATTIFAGAPPGAWVSGIACTNLSTTTINANELVLTFYPSNNATAALTYPDPNPLAGGASRNYFTPNLSGLPSPFAGSAVVSSSQPVACTVNTQLNGNVGTTSAPARVETYSGVDSTGIGPTLYAPQVLKSFSSTNWNSYIAVQNTGSSAVTVNITYKDRNGNAVSAANESHAVAAQSNWIFYQSDNANLPANFLGSATISGGTGSALAAIVNYYNGAADSTTSQFQSYNTFGSGANKLFVPRFVRNYYGFNGGMSIQNVGAAATTVTIVFTFGSNTYNYTSPSISQGASLALYAPNITQLNPVDAMTVSARVGSAVVTAAAGGSVIAIVNEDNRGTCNGASCPPIPTNQIGWGSTYEAFNNGVQKNSVTFPQLTSHVGSQDYSGGFQVANTTGTATTCSITYSAAPAANETNVPLPANGSLFRFGPNIAHLTNPYNASARVSCGQPVIGIGNLGARNPSYFGSTMSTADGILQ